MNILLIEDEVGLCRLLRCALEASRLVVDVAPEGEVGLGAALGGDYALIILDRALPDMDGLEVCQRLCAAGNSTPVLMLTSCDEVEDRVACLERRSAAPHCGALHPEEGGINHGCFASHGGSRAAASGGEE